jgi:hypothetical protein
VQNINKKHQKVIEEKKQTRFLKLFQITWVFRKSCFFICGFEEIYPQFLDTKIATMNLDFSGSS